MGRTASCITILSDVAGFSALHLTTIFSAQLLAITMNRISYGILSILISCSVVARGATDFVALPARTNAVQFRLYTNVSPDASHLFNTFEIEAYGEVLLRSPEGADSNRSLKKPPTAAALHNILVNGAGPE